MERSMSDADIDHMLSLALEGFCPAGALYDRCAGSRLTVAGEEGVCGRCKTAWRATVSDAGESLLFRDLDEPAAGSPREVPRRSGARASFAL